MISVAFLRLRRNCDWTKTREMYILFKINRYGRMDIKVVLHASKYKLV